jgi:hypothetical protein
MHLHRHLRISLTAAAVLAVVLVAFAPARLVLAQTCHCLTVSTSESHSGSCDGAVSGSILETHTYTETCSTVSGGVYNNHDSLTGTVQCGGYYNIMDCSPAWNDESVQYASQGDYYFFQSTVNDAVVQSLGVTQVCLMGPRHYSGMNTCANCCATCVR